MMILTTKGTIQGTISSHCSRVASCHDIRPHTVLTTLSETLYRPLIHRNRLISWVVNVSTDIHAGYKYIKIKL